RVAAAAATVAAAAAASAASAELYSEVLLTEPLRSRNLFFAHFDIRLRSRSLGHSLSALEEHADMFPLGIGRLLNTHQLLLQPEHQQESGSLLLQQQEKNPPVYHQQIPQHKLPHAYSFFDLSLSQGRWNEAVWGAPTAAVKPPGILLRTGISQHPDYNQQRLWVHLVNALAGLTCSGVSVLAGISDAALTLPSAAAAAAGGGAAASPLPSGESSRAKPGYKQRIAAFPEAAVCTDTHNNLMRLLPCKQQSGLLTLLHPYALAASPYKSYRLRASPFAAQPSSSSAPFASSPPQQQQQIAELRLELSVVLRFPNDEPPLPFSLVNLFSQIPLHVYPKTGRPKEDMLEPQQEEVLALQNPPTFARWKCTAVNHSKWMLRIFHTSDNTTAAVRAQQVAAAAGFSTYEAFSTGANSTLLVLDLQQQEKEQQQQQQEQKQEKEQHQEQTQEEEHQKQQQQQEEQNEHHRLKDWLGHRWRLAETRESLQLSRGFSMNPEAPYSDKLFGSYWVAFDNWGDRAASVGLVDFLPHATRPLIATARFSKHPLSRGTQLIAQQEDEGEDCMGVGATTSSACVFPADGASAYTRGVQVFSPWAASARASDLAAVGESALATDVAAAEAEGGYGALDLWWMPCWLRMRSSLLPAALAAKEKEAASLLLPSASLEGRLHVPAHCRVALSLPLRLLMQQPQLLHPNPQGGLSVGSAFAAVPRRRSFTWPPPADVLGSTATSCSTAASVPCSVLSSPSSATTSTADKEKQQQVLEAFLGFEEELEERQWEWLASGGAKLKVPLPDFDMPFNVIAISGTALMIFFGAVFRIAVPKPQAAHTLCSA
ncbi:uncharacterized protein LOC34624136, partial [Cyclospora cayetanensis]|uniref:Uncharacterized protein LOC34624136 n=1 Tax=Cyclospora cayetanensis TaxID=88456 RepID=A0A6P6RT41_9EIME